MIFFSSDHHFYHTNAITYCKRPFDSVEEMNEFMIHRWNEIVLPADTVYYLGDFSLSRKAVEEFTHRLNGTKHLIAGNHDHCHPVHAKKPAKIERMTQFYLDHGWASVQLEDRLLIAEEPFEEVKLHHMPYRGDHTDAGERYQEWRPKDEGKWLLHGHVHGLWRTKEKMINVGVDVWDFQPVLLDAIKAHIIGGAK